MLDADASTESEFVRAPMLGGGAGTCAALTSRLMLCGLGVAEASGKDTLVVATLFLLP